MHKTFGRRHFFYHTLLIGAFLLPFSGLAQEDTTRIIKTDTTTRYKNDFPTQLNDTSLLILNDSLAIVDTNTIVEPVAAKAVIIDTIPIDSTHVLYFIASLDSMKENRFHFIDTSTAYFHQYDPLRYKNKMYATLSNIGMAHHNREFSPTLNTGYQFGNTTFKHYQYQNKDVRYYKEHVPYSSLHYVMGSKKEQNFNLVFSRELIKGLSLGIDFMTNNSPGPYYRSKSNNTRYYLSSQYYTPNRRYGAIVNYLNSTVEVEENGGITYDSIFEQNQETDRRVIPINLNTADNKIKESGFFLEQYFNLTKPNIQNDTVKRRIDPGSITYSIQYHRKYQLYTDDPSQDSLFYASFVRTNDTLTYDSISQVRLKNRFKWSSIGYQENPDKQAFHIHFGITHDYIQQRFSTDSITDVFNQLSPFGGISIKILKSFHLDAYAEYVIGDYGAGDYKLHATLNQYLGNVSRNIGRMRFGLDLTNSTPAWYYQKFSSNRFNWVNDLNKETAMVISGAYLYKKLEAGLKFSSFNNYTYLDDSVRPAQIEKAESLMKIYLKGQAQVKKFGLTTNLVYQTTSQPNLIRIPTFTGVMDLFFISPLFKEAAVVQTGFQFNYFTSYYADAYMPELRMFYLQNDREIGNYVFVDFYLTLRVKTARLFFKAAHLNSYLGNYTYYNAPHYPGRDARFYFGASWRFHD